MGSRRAAPLIEFFVARILQVGRPKRLCRQHNVLSPYHVVRVLPSGWFDISSHDPLHVSSRSEVRIPVLLLINFPIHDRRWPIADQSISRTTRRESNMHFPDRSTAGLSPSFVFMENLSGICVDYCPAKSVDTLSFLSSILCWLGSLVLSEK